MPEPNLLAQDISKRLIFALDKLLSNFSQNPEAREVLQLDHRPANMYSKHQVVQDIFRLGQGTFIPNAALDEEDAHHAITAVMLRAEDLESRAITMYGILLASKTAAQNSSTVPAAPEHDYDSNQELPF